MAFPESFVEEVRSRVRLADVVGRRVKLIRKGHEYSGLCPFHNEKSPSFSVVEDKGFYHCFGCGAHGDVFKFIMEMEGLNFREAVEKLADEVGLEVPKDSRFEAEAVEKRKTLADVMEVSAVFFEEQLRATGGAAAREYLKSRGLDSSAWAQFRLGYSPNTSRALKDHLNGRGIALEQMIEAGVVHAGEGDRGPYDFFRGRVMFPIGDPKGRVIAFGARALEPDAKPKYLNSGDTPLFHKGRVLYNMDRARKEAFAKREIIVAEGYMDVIALSRAGFVNAVAPLGTALTEDQLQTLWRIAPEPVICLDSDDAGLRAGQRTTTRALPILQPGASLRFAFMPRGRDPDDVIRSEGAEAMGQVLERTVPLADVLWAKETAGQDTSTPERRAGLKKRLTEVLSSIADRDVRGFYVQDFDKRLNALLGISTDGPRAFYRGPGVGGAGRFNDRGSRRSFQRKGEPPAFMARAVVADQALAHNRLARSARRGFKEEAGSVREELIVLTLIRHPWLIESHYETIEKLHFQSRGLFGVVRALLELNAEGKTLDKSSVCDHLAPRGLAGVVAELELKNVLNVRFAKADAPPEEVVDGFAHTLARHEKEAILKEELRQAMQAWSADPTDENMARRDELQLRLSQSKGEEIAFRGPGDPSPSQTN